jgi:cytochrome oxidase Cu insertion factor (SCO1/SenC/PrrC family)
MNIQKISPWLALSILAVLAAGCASAPQQPVSEAVQPQEMMTEAVPMEEESHDAAMEDEPGDKMAEENTELPDWYGWELTDVNSGTVFRLSDEQGKVILVETMAVWCSNCLKQQQEVSQLLESLGPRDDFVSLAINIDPNEDSATLKNFTQQNGFDWRYLVASNELINEISRLYGAQYLNPPSTPMLIIDRQGQAHLLPFGIKSAADLQAALSMYLVEE